MCNLTKIRTILGRWTGIRTDWRSGSRTLRFASIVEGEVCDVCWRSHRLGGACNETMLRFAQERGVVFRANIDVMVYYTAWI